MIGIRDVHNGNVGVPAPVQLTSTGGSDGAVCAAGLAVLEVGGDVGVGVVGRPSGCGSLEDEKEEDEEWQAVAVEMVVEVDEEDEPDEGLDGLPVWVIGHEVGSTTARLNHQHVERRVQDRGSGGMWGSPGAELWEGVLRGCWCAAGLRGRSGAWVRLCRPRLLD